MYHLESGHFGFIYLPAFSNGRRFLSANRASDPTKSKKKRNKNATTVARTKITEKTEKPGKTEKQQEKT